MKFIVLLILFSSVALSIFLPREKTLRTYEFYRSQFSPITTNPMTLVKLTSYVASHNAVCLDGSPGAYYLRTVPQSDDWMLYFEGGGWCYSPEDCLGRSKTSVGSSNGYEATIDDNFGGLLSRDSSRNIFANFNLAYFKYCDGNSFSGNRNTPLIVNGTSIYFRGKAIRESILENLLATTNFASATRVVLTGCSAGGLAAFLHSDSVGEWVSANLKKVVSFVAIPISGFFLMENNLLNEPVYPSQIKKIYEISEAKEGLNPYCVSALLPEDTWKCNFAEFSFAFSKVRTFVLNSQMDSWTGGCILTSEFVTPGLPNNGNCSAVPGWEKCGWDLNTCPSGPSFQPVIDLQGQFRDRVYSNSGINRNGNGGYYSSCFTHCEGQGDEPWSQWTVQGIAMNEAVAKWYNGAQEAPAKSNTYIDCSLSTEQQHQCNPKC